MRIVEHREDPWLFDWVLQFTDKFYTWLWLYLSQLLRAFKEPATYYYMLNMSNEMSENCLLKIFTTVHYVLQHQECIESYGQRSM